MKTVNIFGSTGSIGRFTLDIIRSRKQQFRVQGLCANNNIALLKKQIKEFSPRAVCLVNETKADKIKKILPAGTKFFYGESGLKEFSLLKADLAVMAISGLACLKPLLSALAVCPRVALANKEAMVCAGPMIKRKAKKYGTILLPVDSEINALFQLLGLIRKKELDKVFITASGGALFDFSKNRLKKATVKDVLAHPTWSMGKRITVDSATLVNKGFEVVEAHHFFGLDYSQIETVIHRESLAHAFIKSKDGIYFSCMYDPDMRLPIGHALMWPQRLEQSRPKEMFSSRFKACTFRALDRSRFPLFSAVLEAGQKGGNSLTVLNACDETAIEYFLQGRISFSVLSEIILEISSHTEYSRSGSLKEILHWDSLTRRKTKELIEWKY